VLIRIAKQISYRKIKNRFKEIRKPATVKTCRMDYWKNDDL
jgi:hypothetical protein